MNTRYLDQLPEEWEHKVRIFAALGDSTRQKMLLLFEVDETITLKTLVDVLPLSRSAIVHHVTVLEQAGLLIARRQGREVGYILNTAPLITSLENVLDYTKNLHIIPSVASGAVLGAVPGVVAGVTHGVGTGATHGISAQTRSSARAEARAGTSVATDHKDSRLQAVALFVPLSEQELAHD